MFENFHLTVSKPPVFFAIWSDRFSDKLRQQTETILRSMKSHHAEMEMLLRKREAELQKLMRQMKHDKLQTSPVYKNLEQELETLKKTHKKQ